MAWTKTTDVNGVVTYLNTDGLTTRVEIVVDPAATSEHRLAWFLPTHDAAIPDPTMNEITAYLDKWCGL
jgi:hypothetical protein